MLGHRLATIVSAVGAASWFDFFQTRPYYSFTINGHDEWSTSSLSSSSASRSGELAILAGGTIGPHDRQQRHRAPARDRRDGRSGRVARHRGRDRRGRAALPVRAQGLHVRARTVDPIPRSRTSSAAATSCSVACNWGVGTMGLPGKRGRAGRAGLRPHVRPLPAHADAGRAPSSFDRRIIAVALADQVAAAFVAETARTNS